MTNSMENHLKWTATSLLIIGVSVNSLGFYPIGPIILILGSFCWLIVSLMWKETCLIITNSIMTCVGVIGLCIHYI